MSNIINNVLFLYFISEDRISNVLCIRITAEGT